MDLFSMDDAGGDAAHAFFFFFQLRFSIFSRPASKGQRDLLCSLSLTFACGLRRFTRSREKKRGRVDENAKSEPVSFLMSGSREPRAANGRAFLFFFFFDLDLDPLALDDDAPSFRPHPFLDPPLFPSSSQKNATGSSATAWGSTLSRASPCRGRARSTPEGTT